MLTVCWFSGPKALHYRWGARRQRGGTTAPVHTTQPPHCLGDKTGGDSIASSPRRAPGTGRCLGAAPVPAVLQQLSPDGLLHRNHGAALAAHAEAAPRVEAAHAALQPRTALQHGQRRLPRRLLQEPQQDLLAWGAGRRERKRETSTVTLLCPLEPSAQCRSVTARPRERGKARTLCSHHGHPGMLWAESSG